MLARSKRSRLLQPDRFDLDPANPRHLKGRERDVANLLDACVDAPLVELTGESGSGKTALVRSGLIPALERDGRLQPFYLDSSGPDWVSGPLESLAAELQRTLSDSDRAALGLDRPVTRDDVFPLLAAFRGKVGRTPLVIFDQFDDYQATHRGKFLTEKGVWLSPESLADRNGFWKSMSGCLGHGGLHVLLVTWADTAAGLYAVRFCDSKSFPLDRLDPVYLDPLLDELAPAEADPPVVEEPGAGWGQLKSRLERDLTRGGLVLPVQVLFALRGLACLPGRVLTVRNYERVGGVPGLEAAYIGRSIDRCVKTLQSRNVNIEAAQVRALLLAMVDGAKTVPQPLSVLAATPGAPAGEGVVHVLIDLEARGLVRRRNPLPAGPGGGGAAREELWSLYHDYLSRGVLAAEQRANRWANLLRESRRTFEEAAGSLLARWHALLSPWQQIRLAWHRLRGRFRFGEQAAFARWSLLRFAPWLLACAGVWFVADRIAEERRRQEAEVTAVALVQEVARTYENELVRGSALWRLTQSNRLTRRYFWRKVLAEKAPAAGILEKFDLAFHATIGLDPDRKERTYVVDDILAPALNRPSIDANTLRLMARLYAAAGISRDELASLLQERLLDPLANAKALDAKLTLAQALVAVPGKLSREQLQPLFDILKWPVCVGEMRSVILQRLEAESGKEFKGDLSDVARWGREKGLDVTSPPQRP
jgi:hypothetical protein